MRASLGLTWIDQLCADLRFGIRLLRKDVRFTLISVASLALAIGANSTIFAVGKQLLFSPLHVPHPDQLRMLRWNADGNVVVQSMWGDFDAAPHGGITGSVFSYPVYLQLRATNRVLQELIAFKEDSMNATVHGTAMRVDADMVSGNFFAQLEVRPQIGRILQESDNEVPGSGAVAVISDGLWQRSFGRSPSVLGQTIKLNEATVTIVGVAPPGFTGAKNVQMSSEIYVPLSMQPVIDAKGKTSLLSDPNMWWVNTVGRARSDVSEPQAEEALNVELQTAIRATMTVPAGDSIPHLVLVDGSRGLHFTDGTFKKPVYILWALTGLVLLLACANVANLLLARGMQRQREMSVRLAVGAGRSRIVRQLLTESLLLASLGGGFGLLVGYMGRTALPRLLIDSWERSDLSVPFDWPVFVCTAVVVLVAGVLFGLAPAWVAACVKIGSSLKETSLQATKRKRGLNGKAMVAFQIAVSTVLVIGAGLFLRTIWTLSSVDVGFKTDNLLLFEINPPAKRYPPGKDVLLHERIERKIAAIPGVESVAPGSVAYIADNLSNSDFLPKSEVFDTHRHSAEDYNVVGINFFQTMQIPIVAGRGFNEDDTASSRKVGIINQSLARKRFPDENPVGKLFRADRDPNADWIEIVGICRDTRYVSLRDNPPPQFFLPYLQQAQVGGMVYQVRTHLRPADLAPQLRRAVQQIDPDLPIVNVRTQREQINADMQIERAFAALTSGFGAFALALAAVGIYGVMAYSVAQRTNEIGIRLALGAQASQVSSMVLRESFWITLSGIVAGLGAALLLARAIHSMLYGIKSYDPITISGSVVALLLLALGASWIPARRAAGINPMNALRHE
jgi:predicted permease